MAAGLSCELSPLVLAELYRLLAADVSREEELAERLGLLGYDLDWLSLVADAYDGKWQAEAKWLTPETIEDVVLDREHAVVASWVLAGLRHTGHSHDFSADLRRAVVERALKDVADLPTPLPSALAPTVIGWTLGKVVGSIDGSLPVVPACSLQDPHIEAAYNGLVEHVANLLTYWSSFPNWQVLPPTCGAPGWLRRLLVVTRGRGRPSTS